MSNIKDVAKLANLGTSTVSRFFNKTGYVSAESEKRIKDACKKLNYVPNALARAVKTKHTKTVCLIVPNIAHSFFADLSAIIESVCVKRGYKVLLVNGENENRIASHNLHQGFVDGAIFCALNQNLTTLEMDIPIVVLEDTKSLKESVSCVTSNPYNGAKQACEYLIEKGCQHIVYVKNDSQYISSYARENSYTTTMHEHGLESNVLHIHQFLSIGVRNLISQSFDGCIAWNDTTAAQILEKCHDENIVVPDEFQIIGYDDSLLSRYVYPKLTTISQSIENLGTYAANILIDKIEGVQKDEIKIELNCKLVARGTTKN